MSNTDWEARYQSGDMPWEKGAPSPGLVQFLAANPNLPRGTVLIPGCGTGHDVRAWGRAGFEAVGFDLAPSAVQLAAQRTSPEDGAVSYRLGNFLREPPDRRYDWVFEHTLFCAIDPTCRDEYVQAVLRWLKPSGQYLAVSYLIPDTEGPPFGTTRDEQLARFTPHFELEAEWVPHSYPNRVGLERMFWWKRKA